MVAVLNGAGVIDRVFEGVELAEISDIRFLSLEFGSKFILDTVLVLLFVLRVIIRFLGCHGGDHLGLLGFELLLIAEFRDVILF